MMTHLFFRTLGLFSTSLADQAEILYGHITTVWERVKGATREQELVQQINKLAAQLRVVGELTELRDRQVEVAVQAVDAQEAFDEEAARQIATLTEEQAHVDSQCRDLFQANKELDKKARFFQKETSWATLQLTKLHQEREELREERDRLLQQVERVREQLEQAPRDMAAANRVRDLLAVYERIDKVLADHKSGLPPNTRQDTETLLPLYEKHRQGYCQMLQQVLQKLEDRDPARVAIEGLLEVSAHEGRHVQALSALVLFHESLRRTVLGIIKESGS
jgi:chromosome segregation ATPase